MDRESRQLHEDELRDLITGLVVLGYIRSTATATGLGEYIALIVTAVFRPEQMEAQGWDAIDKFRTHLREGLAAMPAVESSAAAGIAPDELLEDGSDGS